MGTEFALRAAWMTKSRSMYAHLVCVEEDGKGLTEWKPTTNVHLMPGYGSKFGSSHLATTKERPRPRQLTHGEERCLFLQQARKGTEKPDPARNAPSTSKGKFTNQQQVTHTEL